MSRTQVTAIHQPNFLPWLGYFYKLRHCDQFVLLDDAEYSKNSYINRNRIKTPDGPAWLTIPVQQSGRSRQLIVDCQIYRPKQSFRKLLQTIEANYAQAPHFDRLFPEFRQIIDQADDDLSQLNEALIRWAAKELDIATPIFRSSTLELKGISGTARLVAVCQATAATHYLAGFGSKKYQEDTLFAEAGIAVQLSEFEHPVYPQRWGEFVPNLSVLDYLMMRPG